jgi:hypothetical protein
MTSTRQKLIFGESAELKVNILPTYENDMKLYE